MIYFHWYGVMYVIAFWLSLWLLPRLAKKRGLRMSHEVAIYVVLWVAIGVIVGGRLGYVLLYEPGYFLAHPVEILAIWRGGMSSHGGFLAAALALWTIARRLRVSFWALADVATVPAALGLSLGRLGNFINQELYVGNFALLAVVKNLVIAAICWQLIVTKKLPPGKVAGVFLIMYSILRFITELFKIPEWIITNGLTLGQLYTLPLLIAGIVILVFSTHKKTV